MFRCRFRSDSSEEVAAPGEVLIQGEQQLSRHPEGLWRRKLSVARRHTLVVFAGSVYLRELRPPPASAEAPREPGPEV